MTTRRTFGGITVGAGLVLAATLVTIGAVGRPGAGPDSAGVLRIPTAVADELAGFADCDRLRQWYVDRALPHVGPWGFGMPYVALDRRGPMLLEGAAPDAPDAAVGSSRTGTNVQEAAVDEPDIAKTDGRILVRVRDRSVVVTDVSTDRPRELSRILVPGPRLADPELLLVGSTVLVLGNEQRYWGGPVPLREGPLPGGGVPVPVTQPQTALAHLVSLDVSDPTSPRVTGDERVDGGIVMAREYGDGTVRVVLTTGYPPLDFVYPNRDRSPAEAKRENRRIVREAPLEKWLPAIRDGQGTRRPLLDCNAVRHPRRPSGFGTLSVLTFDAADPSSYQATAVTAAGDLAYSSADRLYVATAGGRGTHVHAFSLDGRTTSYLGSGLVPGTVRDRWSFDEYDGHLRVATALGRSWAPRESAVVVLDENLRVVGRVDGLGRGELIQSVRWFDDLAVVVTFRQTDPLYTLDLSVPRHPRLLGALKIPGFSSYLHPVGGDRLLGVGQDASDDGSTLGAQAAGFDLRDPGRVRRTGVVGFGPDTESPVGWDPRGFTFLPAQRLALLPVTGRTGGVRVVAVKVADDGALSRGSSWSVGAGWWPGVRTLPLGGDRVALVARGVRVLHVG